MKEWYTISTITHKELKATLNLKRQNFDVYYPKYKKMIKHARKIQTVIRPLFPGYLFVLLDINSQSWHKINSTYGVKQLITMGLKPVSISKDIILSLKNREDSNGVTDITSDLVYKKGEILTVNSGVFQGRSGIFDGLTDDKRIRVLFDILGRKVSVNILAMNINS